MQLSLGQGRGTAALLKALRPGLQHSPNSLPLTFARRPGSALRRPRVPGFFVFTGQALSVARLRHKAKLAAANTQDKLAVDLAVKEIEAEIAARAQASAIIIAEQGRWWTSMIRPLAALLVVIYIWKVIVYDKVLGLGTTDAITGDVGTWAGVIITTYFGGRTIEKVARIFRR